MRSRGFTWSMSDRTRRGATLSWLVLFMLSILLQYGNVTNPSPVDAVHLTDTFELEGDADNDAAPGDDWGNVFVPDSSSEFASLFVDDAINSTPDELLFTGGNSKDIDDISAWRWTSGPGVQDKNDIEDAFAAAYNVDGDLVVYFGLDRYASNGAAQVGFWFLKSNFGTVAGGTFIGSHAVGDVLVQIDFENGGTNPVLRVYEWVGTGGNTSGTLNLIAAGGSCATAPAGDFRCAIANTSVQDSPWPFDPKSGPDDKFPAGSFVEGGINLTDFGLDEGCFASFIAETRSSPSPTSTLSDFAFGNFSLCETPTLTTQVSDYIVLTGGSVTDTATLSGTKGPVTGTVQFVVCGPTTPNCTTGGVLVGSPVTISSGTATSPAFSPVSPGEYCFRAEYTPAAGSKYLAASHTNLDTECFELIPEPTVQVVKTALPTSVSEPGGSVTFTVVVTNTSSHDVTLDSLVDDVHGDLNGAGTCATGGTIATGATYTCTFTATVSGNAGDSETDVVTAEVIDAYQQTASDTDDATVGIVDVLPIIDVVKAASPTSVDEPGGNVTFSVEVTNGSIETVTITSLTDSVYGNLNGKGDCAIGAVLDPGETYACSFVGAVSGSAGSQHVDTVTAEADDDDGNTATDSDDATVVIGDVLPFIQVTKSATPTSVEEPGGNVTFDVTVENVGDVAVTITSLLDDVYGNLDGQGTCNVGAVLDPGQTYSCSFTGAVSGDAGDLKTDIVTACGLDADDNQACDDDDATVEITDALPDITVVKTADPTQLNEPGGAVTFTVEVTNNSVEPVWLTSLVDDIHGDLDGQGTCATGGMIAVGATYTCEFTASVAGEAGDSETDTVTAIAFDNEENQATDSDDATVEITDLLPAITVVKTADPLSVQEPGGDVTFTVAVTNDSSEQVTITSLVDDVYGDLDGKGTCETGAELDPDETYTCEFVGAVSGSAGSEHVDTVTAEAMDNEENTATDSDNATVTVTERPTGTIIVRKETNPDGSNQSFSFVASWEDAFSLTDGQSHSTSGLTPGFYEIDEIDIPAGWTLTGVTGEGGSCNADGQGTVSLEGGQTVTCVFTNTFTPPPPPPPAPGMTIAKTNNTTGAVLPGAAVGFTLTIGVTNASSIANTTIVDQLPTGIGGATGISDGGTYNAATNRITWTGLTVSNGKTLTYTATVSSTASAGSYVNTASITVGPCQTSCSATSTVLVQVVLAETARPVITLPPTDSVNSGDQASSNPGFGLLLALLAIAGIGLVAGYLVPKPGRLRREEVRRR